MEQINPIIKADFPDPDVIRVEDTYYMICTTMHFFPGGIILRSYDLIHWEFASYVFDRLESTDAQRLQDTDHMDLFSCIILADLCGNLSNSCIHFFFTK